MAAKLEPWQLGAPCYVCGEATSVEDHEIRLGRAIHHNCWISWARANPHIVTAVDKMRLAIAEGRVTLEQLSGVAKRVM